MMVVAVVLNTFQPNRKAKDWMTSMYKQVQGIDRDPCNNITVQRRSTMHANSAHGLKASNGEP